MSAETAIALKNQYIERIHKLWHTSREAVVDLGKTLIEAKEALQHGQWLKMIEDELPFSPRSAQRFMQIASDPKLSNTPHVAHLPDAIGTLEVLATATGAKIAKGVADGRVHPDMTREDAKEFVRPYALRQVGERPESELKAPIFNDDEFLETMRGYRALTGESQGEWDHKAGWSVDYLSKLEVYQRRVVLPDLWTWLTVAQLAMILVPAKDCITTIKCPCCGRPNQEMAS